MSHSRIYQPTPLAIQTEISLDSWGMQHVKALRLRENDALIIFNGSDREYCGKITAISAKKIQVTLISEQKSLKESSLTIHLFQAISRGERMDYTIQKSTELGVTSITPLISERCEVRLSDERFQKRQQHWQQIAISACEQTGRTQIPTIHFPQSLSDALQNSTMEGLAIVLDPNETQTLENLSPYFEKTPPPISILIGPEGGLTTAEIELSKKHGFQGLRLGARILRTETAAPALLAALQAKWGDFLL